LPPAERTLALATDDSTALTRLAEIARSALPLTAGSWVDGQLYLRFEGSEATLDEVQRRIGGERLPDASGFWASLREQTHPFFAGGRPLWRCTVPPLAPRLSLDGASLVEWNGLQRWYGLPAGAAAFDAAAAVGGHATLFRHAAERDEVFTPLPPALLHLHRALKREFDPAGILNPGRMYAGL
jgi:glycolate oxidase FAD binding subunit